MDSLIMLVIQTGVGLIIADWLVRLLGRFFIGSAIFCAESINSMDNDGCFSIAL